MFRKRIISTIIGCSLIAPMAFGQSQPPGEETVTESKAVTIIWHKTRSAWQSCLNAYPNASFVQKQVLMTATACFVMVDNICHVYAPDPKFDPRRAGGERGEADKWWALGHEVKHCFDGYFHD